jgi:hypothetical protein
MGNYKKGREFNREGEKGEKVKKYIFLSYLRGRTEGSSNLRFDCAFAVKNSSLLFFILGGLV